MPKPLILVDGSSYLYRAFHAMPSLTNSKRFPTGAIYGVVNMLRRLLLDYDPEYMAVIFDTKGKTFREDLYEHYKANRPPMPDELVLQIESIHAIIPALGLKLIMIEGVEADDVIGTLAKEASEQNIPILISTGDKDFAQLVNENVTLINTMSNTLLNPQTVTEKFGIPPDLIVDYLSLVGDAVDNIPGVPQVGPKTAVKWLKEYGSLTAIMENADKITGKVGENLRASLHQLPLAKILATIKTDVKIDWHLEHLRKKPQDNPILLKIYQELEFKNWLNDLIEKNPLPSEDKFAEYQTIFTEEELAKCLADLKLATEFVLDTETTSLNTMQAKIVGISFAIQKSKAFYIPLAHDYDGAPLQLNREIVLQKLKPILENPDIKKIGHHLKYDYEVLKNVGIELAGMTFDTMLESYILDSSQANHSMDALALKFLNWRTIHFEDVAGVGAKQVTFNKINIKEAALYAAEDADVTLQLHGNFWPKLQKLSGQKYIFTEIEMPLIAVLARMERAGVLIDKEMLLNQSHQLEARLKNLEELIIKEAGTPFNLNSPKQLQDILFNRLKLPILQKTPTGQPSTADAILQELAHEFSLPKWIIEFRGLNKLITTYTKRLPEQINPETNRIHTSYNQTGASTGRLSSSDPNLQNIPIRTEEGRRIRQAFIAAPNYQLISSDYSQIELRIMAHISQDEGLLRAFALNQDIHAATASEVFGIPLEEVSDEERRRAKAINFGLLYGMSAFGLAKQIGVERGAAEFYMERYFARYPGIKSYMETIRQFAKKNGYVETLFGRRLYVPEIHSSQIPRLRAAERAAINAPLQGTAADIIKRAMISLDAWLQQNRVDAKMIMQVHDELVLEVAVGSEEIVIEQVRLHMMNAAELKVPLLVCIGVGHNWDSAANNAT